MAKLTENKVAEITTADLQARAEAIRDAVQARSVTAAQVGSLFLDLIEAAGNVRDALALFLDTNVGEIEADIDNRLAGADAAALAANSAAQKSEATRKLVEELVARLSGESLSKPARIEVTRSVERITTVNTARPQIGARLLPQFGIGSVLFVSDNKAVGVTPDGRLLPLKVGSSTVYAVATADTSVYASLTVEVVSPRTRIARNGDLRLDGKGNIRLT